MRKTNCHLKLELQQTCKILRWLWKALRCMFHWFGCCINLRFHWTPFTSLFTVVHKEPGCLFLYLDSLSLAEAQLYIINDCNSILRINSFIRGMWLPSWWPWNAGCFGMQEMCCLYLLVWHPAPLAACHRAGSHREELAFETATGTIRDSLLGRVIFSVVCMVIASQAVRTG